MKTQAFLIVAHRHASQIATLINKLLSLRTKDIRNLIFVHIDKDAPRVYNFLREVYKGNPNVQIFSEYRVYWGGASVVNSYLLLLGKALDSKCDYYHLLSGEDYPLVTSDIIYRESSEFHTNFFYLLNINSSPDLIDRVKYYHLANIVNMRTKLGAKIDNIFVKIQKLFRISVPKTRYKNLIFNSSLLSSFNERTAYYLYYTHKVLGLYNKLIKTSLIPDEFFLVVPEVADSVTLSLTTASNKRLQKWSDEGVAEFLTVEDLKSRKGDEWFARKIDLRNEKLKNYLLTNI